MIVSSQYVSSEVIISKSLCKVKSLLHKEITLDHFFSVAVKGYFSEFLVSNIIGYLAFLQDQHRYFKTHSVSITPVAFIIVSLKREDHRVEQLYFLYLCCWLNPCKRAFRGTYLYIGYHPFWFHFTTIKIVLQAGMMNKNLAIPLYETQNNYKSSYFN